MFDSSSFKPLELDVSPFGWVQRFGVLDNPTWQVQNGFAEPVEVRRGPWHGEPRTRSAASARCKTSTARLHPLVLIVAEISLAGTRSR